MSHLLFTHFFKGKDQITFSGWLNIYKFKFLPKGFNHGLSLSHLSMVGNLVGKFLSSGAMLVLIISSWFSSVLFLVTPSS